MSSAYRPFCLIFLEEFTDFYVIMLRDNLKSAFAACNLYVKEVAAKSGVKKSTIDNWLSAAKTKEPRALDLYAVCRAVNITMEQAVDGEAGEQYILESVQRKGWVFTLPERIADVVKAADELSDEQLGYVKGLIKTMLNSKTKEGVTDSLDILKRAANQ
jgi:transcriptional regulator with XRE-family HTH domain